MLDGNGKMVPEGKVATTKKAMAQAFGAMRRCRIAMEVGTHSSWVSQLLTRLGHEAIVANARQVKLISAVAARTTGWMRKPWRGWRAWIRSYCGPSGIAARKRRDS